MIWKLLRKNISFSQIAGYAIAALVGLTIVISAVRFYTDVHAAISGTDGQGIRSTDYMVISRPVSMLSSLGLGSSSGFSPEQIAELEQQPWVDGVGQFLAADFSVSASVSFQGAGMSTYMFLEAVPDEFIDVHSRQWRFSPSDAEGYDVPIVISKDYLALYNFGFASTQGLPQLTEGVISKVPITLYLSGNGRSMRFTAHIVGFSQRLNTIAVPFAFLQWANEQLAPGALSQPSRLIVKVSNPGSPQIKQYLSEHGYEVAGDRLDSGKVQFFLSLVTTIVIAIGAVISALALFILMLSITLLLQKNKDKNRALILLGYSPMQVGGVYFRLVCVINAVVLVAAIGIMLWVSHLWQAPLAQLGIAPSAPSAAIITATAIMLVTTLINLLSITRSLPRTGS